MTLFLYSFSFSFLSVSVRFGMDATIPTYQKIQCLHYKGFFVVGWLHLMSPWFCATFKELTDFPEGFGCSTGSDSEVPSAEPRSVGTDQSLPD